MERGEAMDGLDAVLPALLSQIASGSFGEAGARLWDSLAGLVARVWRSAGEGTPDVFVGSLRQGDVGAITDLLAQMAEEHPTFRKDLRAWVEEADRAGQGGIVANVVHGNVSGISIQARDIGNLQL